VNHREPKVVVGARVPPELAREVARLAAAGNRTTSREVAQAIAEHIAQESSLDKGTGGQTPPVPLRPSREEGA
jgi:hypothetical protein